MLIWVIVAGATGALTRVLVDYLIVTRISHEFPWSTFLINSFGAYTIGVAYGTGQLLPEYELYMTIIKMGYLGSFTTFSTFSLQWMMSSWEGHMRVAMYYILASLFTGVLATIAGWQTVAYIL